jgi:uncharacterized membrane protein
MSVPVTPGPEVRVAAGAAVSGFVARLVRDRVWPLTVGAAIVCWTAVLFLVVRDHYESFRLGRYDLGNMVQAVWSTAHGRPLETTNGHTGEQMVRLGSHVDPILAALTPLWLVAPSPLTLVAIQVAAVALGALPVFWLARRHLSSERAAALLALAYLAYPWIAWTAVDAFHPVTLAIPLFLFAVWYLHTDRLWLFSVCAVLAMTTGELMGITVAALGVWYALARRRRTAGLVIAAGGVAWTLIALYVVVPVFSGGASVFYGLYGSVGGTPWGVVRTTFTDPVTILSAVTHGRDLLYVALVVVPLAGAFLLAPALAAVALPQLTANLLSDLSSTTDPHAHYVAGILPFLFAAVAVGLGRLSPRGAIRAAALVLTLCVAATITVGPWPGALAGSPTFYRLDRSEEQIRAVRQAVALVPDAVPVSSTNRAGSHLAERRYLYSVPVVGRADWIVIDSSDTWIPDAAGGRWDPAALQAFQDRIASSPKWRKVFGHDGVLVYRKVDG